MSRSAKDGRRSGAHRRGKRGKEFWSPRPGPSTPSKFSKIVCHSIERQQAKSEVSADIEDIQEMGPRNRID